MDVLQPDPPEVELQYVRPPGRTRTYRQELLHDGRELKITLGEVPRDAEPREVAGGRALLEPGASLLWFTFPGKRYEVASFHGPDGELLGHYTNLVRPPSLDGRDWEITDLFLDVWQPEGPEGAELLDRDELAAARERGWIGAEEAREAAGLARRILAEAREGAWPPAPVRRWTLERVPELRLRRDRPGLYHANLVANRIIAVGMYFLGAASLTTAGFAAATDALVFRGTARVVWLAALGVEAAALTGVGLAGRLPATRRVRPEEVLTEPTLFWGSALAALAVLVVHESSLWETLLSAVYGTLALFLVIFALARAALDRRFPGLALAGLAICALALVLL